MAAFSDRGRYRNSVLVAAAIVRVDAGTSERTGARQTSARNLESDDCDQRWKAVSGHVDPRRRQSGPGLAANVVEYSGVQHDAAGSGGSAAIPDRALLR